MRNLFLMLIACGVALALSDPARAQERAPANADELRTLDAALTAPGYTMRDVNDWLDGQGVSADRWSRSR